MEDTLQIDPDILREALMRKCSAQVIQIVRLEAAVQQLLNQVEAQTGSTDSEQIS